MQDALSGTPLNLEYERFGTGQLIALNGIAYEFELMTTDALFNKFAISVLTSFLSWRQSQEAEVEIQPQWLTQTYSLPVTRPSIVLRSADPVCTHRIQINVSGAGEQIAVRFNRTALEAAFPRRPGTTF